MWIEEEIAIVVEVLAILHEVVEDREL